MKKFQLNCILLISFFLPAAVAADGIGEQEYRFPLTLELGLHKRVDLKISHEQRFSSARDSSRLNSLSLDIDLPRKWKAGVSCRREQLTQADRDQVTEDRYVLDLEKGIKILGRTQQFRLRYQDGEELMEKFDKDEQRQEREKYLTLRWKFDDRLKTLYRLEWQLSAELYSDISSRKYEKIRLGTGLSRQWKDLKVGSELIWQIDSRKNREKLFWQLGAAYDIKLYKLFR